MAFFVGGRASRRTPFPGQLPQRRIVIKLRLGNWQSGFL
jgi:hypothetical protein